MAKKSKTILEYPVIFNKAKEGGYNVSFPDFPGCVTFGKTFEESEKKAKEVLELWIEELKANNEEIPIAKSRPIISEIPIAIFTKN
ncbi:type II toxin-antitoxin system HicB family antitoxin [Patescibacteria group bacterium]|nr:type II toxin-antitoxin system HicB family antitoxin [Patescibacteria group bacterium]